MRNVRAHACHCVHHLMCACAGSNKSEKRPEVYSAILTPLTDLLSQRGIGHFGVIRQAAILCLVTRVRP